MELMDPAPAGDAHSLLTPACPHRPGWAGEGVAGRGSASLRPGDSRPGRAGSRRHSPEGCSLCQAWGSQLLQGMRLLPFPYVWSI